MDQNMVILIAVLIGVLILRSVIKTAVFLVLLPVYIGGIILVKLILPDLDFIIQILAGVATGQVVITSFKNGGIAVKVLIVTAILFGLYQFR